MISSKTIFSVSRDKLHATLSLLGMLNSVLMLPFAIHVNYVIIIVMLLTGQKLKISTNVIPFILLLLVVIYSAAREVASPNGTTDGIHYFISSFLWQIGYLSFFAFQRPSSGDIAKFFLLCAFIQGLIIIARLSGLFYFPIYGGLLESNAGFVSIHQREQISAVSISFSLWIWLIYGSFSIISVMMCLVAVFSLLFTGSMGAFLSIVAMVVSRLILDNQSIKRLMIRISLSLCVLVPFFVLLNQINNQLSAIDLGGFDTLQSTRMVADVVGGGDWIYYKLFEANSRAQILQNYGNFTGDDLISLFVGFSKGEWMELNGELGSPHSFFLEFFVHGGLFVGLYFVVIFILIFISSFGLVRGGLYLFSFFTISIINSNNFAMPYLAIILTLLPSVPLAGFSCNSRKYING